MSDMTSLSKNSALFWLPRILRVHKELVPLTEIVPFSPEDLFPLLDSEPHGPGFSIEAMRTAAERIGVPAFVRTDLASAKHVGPSAYRLDSLGDEDLWRVVCQTFEDVCTKLLEAPPQAFLVRQWLELPAPFTAFDGHPIAREWRLFVENSGVTAHFYWPKAALASRLDHPTLDWEAQHADLARPLSREEFEQLEAWARWAVASVDGDEWSVDFAQDVRGRWWLIDMALAEQSWRPS
jgi:hypothetical protein